MAWCTFSSDDYACDLRLSSLTNGFTINTAWQRVIGDIPKTEHLQGEGFELELEAAEREQIRFVNTAAREPIGLPHAGEEFVFEEFEDFVEKVRELVDIGYRIPEAVAVEFGLTSHHPAR
ncbi:hypothetical protein D3C71_250250 [compost metagenome]